MFLTAHAASATVIAKFAPNPILAFLIGLVSHLVLDIIPHGDTEIMPEVQTPGQKMPADKKERAKKLFLATALVDTTILFLLFSGIFIKLPINPVNYAYALLGTLLLDLIDHTSTLFLAKYNEHTWFLARFHFRIHHLHKRLGIKDYWLRGFILQFALIAVILFLNVYVWSS